MKLKIALTAAAATLASTQMALAVVASCPNGYNPATGSTKGCGTAVPEISALEGTAALAAIAAFVFIAWERRRRAA